MVTVTKKRRGRPPVLNEDILRYWANMAGTDTRRSTLNHYYALHACYVLGGDDMDLNSVARSYPYLIDPDLTDTTNKRCMKMSVLTELGRIKDDEVLVEVAQVLCERSPPTVKEAREWVRFIRLKFENEDNHE